MFFKKKKETIKFNVKIDEDKLIDEIMDKLDKAIDEIVDNIDLDNYVEIKENDKK